MRLFVAVELDDLAREALARLAERLGKSADPVSWIAPANFHLTMKFLGEAAEGAVPEIEAACGRAATGAAPFDMRLRGVGAYPSARRPRVVWAGIEAPPVLPALVERVEEEISPLGFPREKRPWSPHVTLGRVREPHARRRPRPGRMPGVAPLLRNGRAGASLEAALAREAAFEGGTVRVADLTLMRSELRRTGAVYTAHRRFSLGAGEA